MQLSMETSQVAQGHWQDEHTAPLLLVVCVVPSGQPS